MLAATLAIAWCEACDGCERDRPYTPFGVTSALPRPPLPDASLVTADASTLPAPSALPMPASKAPPGALTWNLGGRQLAAPKARRFELGLVADFDDDRTDDALVWAVPLAADDPTAGRGELWYYPSGSGEPRLVTSVPGFVPAGPSCRLKAELSQTGKRTVALVTRAECDTALVPRAPVQGVQVLAPARSQPLVIGFRVAAAAEGERLSVAADTRDRDNDGRDDVDLQVTCAKADSKTAPTAHVVWLDRAAGPSQTDDEPSRSLAKLASLEQVRAKGKTTSRSVPAAVDDLRRLIMSLCAESQTPRVWDWDGAPLGCGNLERMADRVAHAEVQSALTRGEPVAAFAALERDGWHTPRMSSAKRSELEQLVRAATRQVAVTRRVTVSVPPAKAPSGPHFSPLAFASDGTLLVQEALRRVHAVNADGQPSIPPDGGPGAAAASTPPWPLLAQSSSGETLGPVVYACDRSEVFLTIQGPGAAAPRLVSTELLSPRPGACSGRAGFVPPEVQAIGWTPGGASLLLAGTVVGAGLLEQARQSPAPGSPLSPDGKWLVTRVSPGLVLAEKGGQVELWTSSLLGDASDLADCVVSNGGKHVACVQASQAVLFSPQRP